MDDDLANWVAASVGAPIERVVPLRVEASHRRFYRIWMAQLPVVRRGHGLASGA